QVVATKKDITNVRWQEGDIALLFIDLCKAWKTNNHVVQEFFPWLAVGAVVVQQDYMFFRNPWVASSMYKLRAHTRYAGKPDHNSMLFTVTERIPAAACEQCRRQNTTTEEVLAAFDWTAELVGNDYRALEMLDM